MNPRHEDLLLQIESTWELKSVGNQICNLGKCITITTPGMLLIFPPLWDDCPQLDSFEFLVGISAMEVYSQLDSNKNGSIDVHEFMGARGEKVHGCLIFFIL